jgi:protein-tyrosine phosphatase
MMIDLHSHILPGIDDGASELAVSLDMARAWVDDGVTTVACTPHILPGLFHNTGPQIRNAVAELQNEIDQRGIPLKLATGADNHVIPNFVAALQDGHLLSLGDTRYVLVEPPHHTAPPRLGELLFSIMTAGFVPILTHPERLTWIETHYDSIRGFAERGVWMQITAGALTGSFGRSPKYWGERMLCEGLVHILATDAHNMGSRPPVLADGRKCAENLIGSEEARRLVEDRPLAILEDRAASSIPSPTPVKMRKPQGSIDDVARNIDRTNIPLPRGSSHDGRYGGVSRWLQRFFP